MIIRTRATPFAILVILVAVALAPVEELQTYAMASASQDQKQQTADTQSRERPQADAPQDGEETESEELSPASVQLDTSSFPPLILALYQATRETKEKPVVAKLAEVRELIEKGSDVTTNVFFIGKREELEAAFQAAGWKNADHLGLKSAMEELRAAARKSGYDQAPVSLLTLNGAQPDVVFQKALNTISKRHHVRLWKQTGVLYEGREIWVAAATHDIGVAASGKGTKWFHRIDPRVDREREWIKNELLFAGAASGYALVERPAAPTRTRNATGDEVITDGKMLVLALGRSKASP
jgi:LssY C-terminus